MLKWFGHVERMDERRLTKEIYEADLGGNAGRVRVLRVRSTKGSLNLYLGIDKYSFVGDGRPYAWYEMITKVKQKEFITLRCHQVISKF
jgi:hypothetical protein